MLELLLLAGGGGGFRALGGRGDRRYGRAIIPPPRRRSHPRLRAHGGAQLHPCFPGRSHLAGADGAEPSRRARVAMKARPSAIHAAAYQNAA